MELLLIAGTWIQISGSKSNLGTIVVPLIGALVAGAGRRIRRAMRAAVETVVNERCAKSATVEVTNQGFRKVMRLCAHGAQTS